MRSLRFAVLLFTTLSLGAYGVDVYIVAGQSNGWRISSLSAGPERGAGAIHYVGMGCVSEPIKGTYKKLNGVRGMGAGLALSLSKLSNDDMVFIQYCRCGAPTWSKAATSWYPGEDPRAGKVFRDGLLGRFIPYVSNARSVVENELKLKWELKGLFWHQGESDSTLEHAAGYEERVDNLFFSFRQALGGDLPIVAGQVREVKPESKLINAALERIAASDPLTATIHVQDLACEGDNKGKKNVHFNAKGCREMGVRMAKAFAELQAQGSEQ